MGKTLFIAEKPSVAMTIAQALGINGTRNNGYIESDDKIITWCVGHLVRLSYPEKYDEALAKWEMETLPFVPEKEKFLYETNESVKEQYEVVAKMYKRTDIDTLYIYPDDGQEGYYLQALVLMHACIRKGIKVYCCICDSQTDDEIRRAYSMAEPWDSERITRIIKAGYMRAKEDYLVGINYSRVLTLKYESLLSGYIGYQRGTIAVGRVMSCVLGMVVKREREIADFTAETYYKITANFDDGLEAAWKDTDDSSIHNSPIIYEGKGIKKKEDAEVFISGLPSYLTVKKVEIKTEKKKAPLLYSLTELQADCAKKFKYNPQKVLDIAQILYEKKLTSYPRTDSKYLPTSLAKEIDVPLEGIRDNYPDLSEYAKQILFCHMHDDFVDSRYVDDKKIDDHYAIIPTGKGFENLASLTVEQATVYDLIVRRFLSVFYPPAEFEKAEVELVADREHFFLSRKMIQKPGYLEIAGYEQNKEETKKDFEKIRKLAKDSTFAAIYGLTEQETSPPKRYSSSSLLLAMDNAGQFVEDEELREVLKDTKGIGTTATRAGILEKLVKTNHYLDLNEKTQIYKPTYKGELIYDILNENIPTILNPTFSASWTSGLKQIEKGQIEDTVYFEKLTTDVKKNVIKIKGANLDEQLKGDFTKVAERYKKEAQAAKVTFDCPLCKSPLKPAKNGFICSKFAKEEERTEDSCTFYMPRQVSGKTLSDKMIEKLLKDKYLDIMNDFKKSDGTKFSAPLYLLSNGKLSFKPEGGEDVPCGVKCPECGRELKEGSYAWKCDCGFSIQRMIAHKAITKEQMKKIVSGEGTDVISGFKGKNGTFAARLVLKDGKTEFKFRDGFVEGVSCPACGKKMKYVPFGIACEDYNNGCSCAVGSKVSGKALSDKMLITLLRERQLPEMKGFKKQNGDSFSSALYINSEGKMKFGYLPKKTSIICPVCHETVLYATGQNAECPKCHAKAPYIFHGRQMTKEDIENLLKFGRTARVSGFVKKDGGKFSAVVKKTKEGRFEFEFSHAG